MGSVSRCWSDDTQGRAREAGKAENPGDDWAAGSVSVLVMTADAGLWRRLRISIRSPLRHLADACAEAFGVGRPEDFAFFQVGEGSMHLCQLTGDAAVINFFYSWKGSQHHGEHALLYKRDVMRVGEKLRLDDAVHARLTYQQALGEHLRSPIVSEEELPLVLQIAAAVFRAGRCRAEEEADGEDDGGWLRLLSRDGALEQILPEAYLQALGRAQAAADVARALAAAAALPPAAGGDGGGEELAAMGSAFELMQQKAFFGSTVWPVRQAAEVPQDDWQVLPPNPSVYVVDPAAPSRDYWLCVDPFGLRLVAQQQPDDASQLRRTFQQGFFFEPAPGCGRGEASELPRLLSWRFVRGHRRGGGPGTVQLLVSGPGAEGEACEMTLALESPAALEIRHTIGRMHSESRAPAGAAAAARAAPRLPAAWYAAVLPRALTLLPCAREGGSAAGSRDIRCYDLRGELVAAVPAEAHTRVETLRTELARQLQTPAMRLKLATQGARLLQDGDLIACI